MIRVVGLPGKLKCGSVWDFCQVRIPILLGTNRQANKHNHRRETIELNSRNGKCTEGELCWNKWKRGEVVSLLNLIRRKSLWRRGLFLVFICVGE